MSDHHELLSAYYLSDEPEAVLAAVRELATRSHGRITKPERFNERTRKPERGGLHCGKVFGPIEDFACLCGFLTLERDPDTAGQRCPKCGVECIERKVRAERWAHLECTVPLLHPALSAAIAERLGCGSADLAKVVAREANLNDDGTIVAMVKDEHGWEGFEDEAEEQRRARGAPFVAERLGEDSALTPTLAPVTPSAWRESPRNACDVAYARLINRNHRLARLRELNAPTVILKNEERMTQEAFARVVRVLRTEIAARRDAPTQAPPRELSTTLLQAIFDAPQDDAPRAVYADFLIEHGDPRGEFIALQLKDPTAKRISAKQSELLRRHYMQWLEPLDEAVRFEVFRRGFLVACKTIRDPATALVGDPAWSTVERIDTDIVDLVTHPVMRSLREVRCTFTTFDKLCRHPAGSPLDRVDTAMVRMTSSPPRGWQAAVECPGLPSLRDLTLLVSGANADWDWLLPADPDAAGPLAQRLTTLTLGMAYERLEDLRLGSWIERLGRYPSLSSLCLSFGKGKLRWVLQRAGEETSITLHTSRSFMELVAISEEPWVDRLGDAVEDVDPARIERFEAHGKWGGDDFERLAGRLRAKLGSRAVLPEVESWD